MWSNVKRYFEGQPERLQIARILIENGLSVKTGGIYVNEIEIPPIRVARAAGVDRRTVKETVNAILTNRELRLIFEELRCAGHSLKEVARHIGLGVIEITPSDAKIPGILAGAATILAKNDISIRQAIVDDPELSPEPKLTLITEKKIPGELISEVLKIQGVVKVSLY
jgi:predicted regulator of amino acid metabolism with ACT domain